MITLVLGGARSGKSRHAMQLARSWSEKPAYVATSRLWDSEHAARIARHRADRGPEWVTLEEERNISRAATMADVIVVDCVTLWLMNFFADAKHRLDPALEQAKAEFERARGAPGKWIFVSNEIGLGIHAESEVGRRFTDLQGFMNQHIARHAESVLLMVCGYPLRVKGELP